MNEINLAITIKFLYVWQSILDYSLGFAIIIFSIQNNNNSLKEQIHKYTFPNKKRELNHHQIKNNFHFEYYFCLCVCSLMFLLPVKIIIICIYLLIIIINTIH